MKATRKPAKGGLPNAMFVQAAVESLPEELNDVANAIHINFPWGSLLRAVATGDEAVLQSLRCIAAPHCRLEILIGIDALRDKAELARLEIPEFTLDFVASTLVPRFAREGFEVVALRDVDRTEWSKIETSWARKLSSSHTRSVTQISFTQILPLNDSKHV